MYFDAYTYFVNITKELSYRAKSVKVFAFLLKST